MPITARAQAVPRAWLRERGGEADDPLFPTRTGRRLRRGAVEPYMSNVGCARDGSVRFPARRASHRARPPPRGRNVSSKDVDIATFALWLGQSSIQTAHICEHADPALKEQANA